MQHRSDVEAADALKHAYQQIRSEIGKVIVGQDEVVKFVLISIFSNGHCQGTDCNSTNCALQSHQRIHDGAWGECVLTSRSTICRKPDSRGTGHLLWHDLGRCQSHYYQFTGIGAFAGERG